MYKTQKLTIDDNTKLVRIYWKGEMYGLTPATLFRIMEKNTEIEYSIDNLKVSRENV